MTRKQEVWGDGLTVLDDSENAGLPLVLRRAKAFERVMREMPIAIEEGDLVVGNTALRGVIVRTKLPKYATDKEQEKARSEGSQIADGLGHKTPDYYGVMGKGLTGIIADVDNKIAMASARPESAKREETIALLRAIRIECVAVIAMANRYADLASALAAGAGSAERRAELLDISKICRRVPEFPPRTFHEAVQSFWFVHYALFSTVTAPSCGRIDQYLYPTLRRELDAGKITLERAQELIDCLWLRFNDRAQICRENFYVGEARRELNRNSSNGATKTDDRPKVAQRGLIIDGGPTEWKIGHRKRLLFATDYADAINHFGQNILLGGISPDGSDGTNELTYLCLNSLEKFALTSPVVTVRLHTGSPARLVVRSAEVLKSGGGMPYINNDHVLVQAYVDLGVPLEDARNYANSNCWETMIEGKSDQELLRGMNFLLFLELALNRGRSSVHGQMGPDTGDPCTFTAFQELMNAWKVQMDTQLQCGIDYIGSGFEDDSLEDSGHGRYSCNPFLSALTLDCVANERDVTHGGARYTVWHVMGEAVANAINSMAAIKKMVFEDKTLSMEELLDALAADWKDHEILRQRLMSRAPKFANDDRYADEIGRQMMDYFVERTRLHAARYPKVIFPCAVGTFSWYAMIGMEVGATADGRHAGEPVAANFSPALGTDLSGPTAAIGSYLKMPVGHLASGAPLDLRIAKSSVKGEEGTKRITGLVETFIQLGGNMLTLTVTDVEELKRAMAEPEKYRHLRVRMGGWSAYFVMLGEDQQRLHIKRVEHGLV
ncbi:MAG: hypothetical protein HYX90_08170 [Chloroflexi bacterium]|nr:hypothetical protein [Chloroflexota bacterium]